MSFTADSVTAEANAQNRFVQNQPAQNRQSKDPSRVAVIVLGAGSGTRLGEPIPKAAVRVQGRTLLDHALQGARESRVAEHVAVTVPAGCESLCPELLEDAHRAEALVTVGGDTRTASVVAALDALREAEIAVDYVLIHDCARSFTPPEVYHRVLEGLGTRVAAGTVRAVIPVLPVVDTIKTVDASAVVTGTPARSSMRAVQTPQGFEVVAMILGDSWRFEVAALLAAHERSRALPPEEAELLTDDAMAMEAAGEPVLTVAGHEDAFKVTTPMDLKVARALFGGTRP